MGIGRQVATIATGGQTTAADRGSLPDGKTLLHVSIRLSASEGPALVGASVAQTQVPDDTDILGSREFIRASAVSTAAPDIWVWTGEVNYQTDSSVFIFVRNESGADVTYQAIWSFR